MHYTQLGHSGIQVSKLCLGTMTWGEQNSRADAFAQLDMALAKGINFIDTAEMYPVPPRAESYGLTEQYIGEWLSQRQCRDQVILASKIMSRSSDLNYVRGGNNRLNRQHITAAVDASLQRLQTDTIDLYQLHWPERRSNYFGQLGYHYDADDDATPIRDTLEALAELIKAGRIRTIGISNETPWGVLEYLRQAEKFDLPRIVSIQNPYSLLNRTYEIGLAEISQRENIGLLAYSPLGFGSLSGKYLNGARPAGARLTLFDRFRRYTGDIAQQATADYVAIAQQHQLDPAQMALAYVTSRSFLTSTIIGATNCDQLAANIASIELALDADVLAAIEAVHQRHPNPCP